MIQLLKHIKSLELIDYYFLLRGKTKVSINSKLKGMPKSILFVCTGNICRSAYAEKKFLDIYPHPELKVSSAGLATDEGKQADPQATKIAAKRKINLNSHRTQCATTQKMNEAELILVMDSSHYEKIDAANKHKVKYLGAFANENRISIQDPFNKSDEFFEKCFDVIDQALRGLKNEMMMHSDSKVTDSQVATVIFD